MKTVFQYSFLALVFWIASTSIGWGGQSVEERGAQTNQLEEQDAFRPEIIVPEFFLSASDDVSETSELFNFEQEEEDSQDSEEDLSSQDVSGDYSCFIFVKRGDLPCHCARLSQIPNRWNEQNIPLFQVIQVVRI